MQLRTRVLVGGGTMIALAATAVITNYLTRREPPARPAVTEPPTAAVSQACPTPATVPSTPSVPEPPQAPPFVPEVGTCEVSGLPAGYALALTDEQRVSFTQFLAAWVADPIAHPPPIAYRRGVLYAESEEDRGDDGPYPRSAAPETHRVCGTPAVWLQTSANLRYAASAIESCCGNVCTYGGMEYAPNGILVFRPTTRDGETQWALDAWVEWYSASLHEDIGAANHRYVMKALERSRGDRCAGEPDGAY